MKAMLSSGRLNELLGVLCITCAATFILFIALHTLARTYVSCASVPLIMSSGSICDRPVPQSLALSGVPRGCRCSN
jgi:hypothetical protein